MSDHGIMNMKMHILNKITDTTIFDNIYNINISIYNSSIGLVENQDTVPGQVILVGS